MSVFYNDNEPFVCRWLTALCDAGEITPGDVDSRSIKELTGADVAGYTRAHFFAGIGGWDLALRLAGWPVDAPVWTGSCPCQPFSAAGKRQGGNDARHLWPDFRRLIEECEPPVIFGEQVASSDGREWLARVRADLEAMGYAVGAADLCAAGVGAPHIRQRLYWVADANGGRCEQRDARQWRLPEFGEGCQAVLGSDGTTRRIDATVLPLANGVSGRVGRLRGYGNSIVPQVAAAFIRAFMEARAEAAS